MLSIHGYIIFISPSLGQSILYGGKVWYSSRCGEMYGGDNVVVMIVEEESEECVVMLVVMLVRLLVVA